MRFAIALLLSSATTLRAEVPGQVVFSEIMWMGSSASSADEWLELYNRSDAEIGLAGWTITRLADGQEEVMLHIEKGQIPPGGVFLIANYPPEEAHSALAVKPDLVNAAIALSNTRLQLRLYDGDPQAGARLVDVADDGSGAPLAGDSQLKKAMVRVLFDGDGAAPASWATAQEASGWDPGAPELGTPGQAPPRPRSASSEASTPIRPVTWALLKAER